MYEAIKNFNKQFLYEPKLENEENLVEKKRFIIAGIGGSLHAAKLLKVWDPSLEIIIHSDYGLPAVSKEELNNRLMIISSYSGNTEEPLDVFQKAKEKNLKMVVISVGGKLLALAKENNIPYIQLPDTKIQPRSALGFSIKALLKIIKEEELKTISELSKTLNIKEYEEKGKILVEKIRNYIPIVYASNHNSSLAEIWKIKLNETGKIPAFHNVFPELNHNEMTGFDVRDSTRELSNRFYFLILKDADDGEKITKRMEVLEKLYQDRNLKVEIIKLEGDNIWLKIFSSLVLADWTAYYTALAYGLDPEQVPMVEEFKKLILE